MRRSVRKALVVEDEVLVRLLSVEILGELGFEVQAAENADEALALLEEDAGVSLVFSDIRMPGSMDGLGLASRVHQRWPGIRLLLTSGDTRPSTTDLPDESRFLPKPFSLVSLARELEALAL
ncbi:response regulator [Sphingomonas morindae]|uniref:Response regulator n=1 Tax=Sphingomonas morindae TaxID=1541170 RepID=A0ABY4XDJ6_9SPHN|nr:response regulator [Sphingomonas morindae]USI74992.1 response regulator [Sphingomonas morindae]